MRCFVAVDLSSEARHAIAGAQASLRVVGPRAEVSWVDPVKMHLTLKFLGEVAEDALAAVTRAVGAVAQRHAPFTLVAGGLGVFPGRSRPRVLWAGLTGGLREIGLLAVDVERACAPLGFPPEARPFRGHVTLGRVRSPRSLVRVLDAMDALAERSFGTWTVEDVVLYRSHLHGSRGSVYEPLARLALGSESERENG